MIDTVTVFQDGSTTYLADGFHRLEAHRRAGRREIEAEVQSGTREDALWFALGANGTHGHRLTAADKKHAIELALEAWPERSQRRIAEQIGCTHQIRQQGTWAGGNQLPPAGTNGRGRRKELPRTTKPARQPAGRRYRAGNRDTGGRGAGGGCRDAEESKREAQRERQAEPGCPGTVKSDRGHRGQRRSEPHRTGGADRLPGPGPRKVAGMDRRPQERPAEPRTADRGPDRIPELNGQSHGSRGSRPLRSRPPSRPAADRAAGQPRRVHDPPTDCAATATHWSWTRRTRHSRARLRPAHRPGNNRRTKPMGEIRSNVTLENTVDRGVFDRGHGQEADIRRSTVDGIVETGAVTRRRTDRTGSCWSSCSTPRTSPRKRTLSTSVPWTVAACPAG